jgi:hypothetical protein
MLVFFGINLIGSLVLHVEWDLTPPFLQFILPAPALIAFSEL